MISPWFIVPHAQYVGILMLFFRKCTEPSQNTKLAPPGWLLAALKDPVRRNRSPVGGPTRQLGVREFGGSTKLPMLTPELPIAQDSPLFERQSAPARIEALSASGVHVVAIQVRRGAAPSGMLISGEFCVTPGDRSRR